MQIFRKIAKSSCREMCEPQNLEINLSRKFHVIRYTTTQDNEDFLSVNMGVSLLYGTIWGERVKILNSSEAS